MSEDLIIGNFYKRIDLNNYFNTDRFASSREGILSIDSNIILFCTLEKTLKDAQFHYNDYFENDFFRWDSQNPQHINTPMIQKMVNGDVDIFLFCRLVDKIKSKSQPFIYCGRLEFSEHYNNTAKPVHIIFESIDYQDNPNEFLKEIYDSNMLEMKLESIIDYFLCDGQGLFYFRPSNTVDCWSKITRTYKNSQSGLLILSIFWLQIVNFCFKRAAMIMSWGA